MLRKTVSFIFLIIILKCLPVYSTISTSVCYRESMIPLDPIDPNVPYIFDPICVGTELALFIGSDVNEAFNGTLSIEPQFSKNGRLYARGPKKIEYMFGEYTEEGFDGKLGYIGSILPATGFHPSVFPGLSFFPGGTVTQEVTLNNGHDAFNSAGEKESIEAGQWFVLDYNAIEVGFCQILLHSDIVRLYMKSKDIPDSKTPPPTESHPVFLYTLTFEHVPTRDFDKNGRINFEDFAVMGQNWKGSYSIDPHTFDVIDLDASGTVDSPDLEAFSKFWLRRTR